jgi:AbrB family looped-hinge helix DNA binding protein
LFCDRGISIFNAVVTGFFVALGGAIGAGAWAKTEDVRAMAIARETNICFMRNPPGSQAPRINLTGKLADLTVKRCLPLKMVNGNINGMHLKIDQAGRIVVPKPMRDRLGLRPNTELEIVEQAGGLLLRPAESGPSMIKVNGRWVHQGVAEPGADLTRVLDDVREERIQSILKSFYE